MAGATTSTTPSTTIWPTLLFLGVVPVAIAILLYRADRFDPAPLPDHGSWPSRAVPARNDRILKVAEKLGDGLLHGPEDMAYDAEAHVLYTGCYDGWIKKVTLADVASSVTVDNWVHVGGRPLGVALGLHKDLIVADANKGLLRVTTEGTVELLTNEAEGLKFHLTDGVDVASDGMIYFTDASHKYSLDVHMMDIMEGRPYGRLMSFDPSTKKTQVLVRGLYFANGVALSPQHDFLVFCETVLRRCRKYHIQGEKKGSVDDFVDNLPGYPDNIRCDGDGHFWIGIATGRTLFYDSMMMNPFIRKTVVIIEKFVKMPHMQQDGGVLEVSLEGEPLALYSDPALFGVTGGLKVRNHLYYGLLAGSYIGRIDLTRHAARAK
ncbi:protein STRICTOSIDINE SYNTHASE-LIKE 5-like [Magnolia sinica]|uniref:protein STRICTOSIDINE SYNTHASE-LIKE 5-like n=1 Tax=Magnolia sinica TaxID=86752 RepID=UPI002658F431|nr:protein STRICTOSIDINE SYNTHASE-LIKE 5-like [Magnolia sinica]